MAKEDCERQAIGRLNLKDTFETHLRDHIHLHDPTLITALGKVRTNYISNLRKDGELTAEEEAFYTTKMNDITLLMHEEKDVGAITGKVVDVKEKLLKDAIDKLVECECGPGQELKEVQLKIPIMISETVKKALEKSGYDVGTDAYYADPERFVTVIVRPTKELELRSGG